MILHCKELPHFAYPFICWWAFGLLEIMKLGIFVYTFWYESVFVSLDSDVQLLDPTVILCLTSWGAARLFQGRRAIFHSHRQCPKLLISPHPRQHFLLFVLSPRPRLWLLIFRESGREGETLMWERNIDRLSSVHALTGARTRNLLMYGMMLQPAEPPGQGNTCHF